MNDEKTNDWEALDQLWNERLDQVELAVDLNAKLFRESRESKISQSLKRFVFFAMLDIVFAFVVILFLWTFLLENWPVGYLLIPSLTLLAFAYLFMGANIYDLVLVSRIDFGHSVVDNQIVLEKLKASRIRSFKWVLLLSPWMGFSFLMILIAWLTDFQIFQKLSLSWIIANFVFGILVIPAGIYVARVISRRPRNSDWVQKTCDSISGRNLANASKFLNELHSIQTDERNNKRMTNRQGAV